MKKITERKRIVIFFILFILAVGTVFHWYTGEYTETQNHAATEEATDFIRDNLENAEETAYPIVGTWTNTPNAGAEEWATSYRTRFSSNGREVILNRSTDRKAEIQVETEQGTESCTATDFDDYDEPLKERLLELAGVLSEGGEAELELADLPYTLADFTLFDITGDGMEEIFAYVEPVWQWEAGNDGAIYIISPVSGGGYTILSENTDFRRGYTDILAPDGTELFSQKTYYSASSWKGGIRLHLGYRDGQIVVDKEESYSFHWDFPLINYVNDYKNGIYYVYVARNPNEGKSESYGSYIGIGDSIKIDEEDFAPVLLPFTGFEPRSNDYPAVYPYYHPFPEGWWQDGGKYPEDGESCGIGMADWIDEAADDKPDEMLQVAVEESGYEMEKIAYPWTAETKENVIELLRCPVADYYYVSDNYAAYYDRGQICFSKINETE